MHPYIRTFGAAELLSLMGFAGRVPTRKQVARVFEQARHTLGDVRDPRRHDQAELAQETADLVGLRGARLDESLPDPGAATGQPAARRS